LSDFKEETMLVLTRKKTQTIVIGESVKITVLHLGGDRIRLGIEAPADVPIRRGELEPHLVTEEQQAA
jgi:carbon storage regulator